MLMAGIKKLLRVNEFSVKFFLIGYNDVYKCPVRVFIWSFG